MTEKPFDAHTIEDIAKLSGYSRSTVSRVITGHPNVSERARVKIQQVMAEHNYSPHPAAQALASQRSRVISVLIPHIVSELFSDPFFPTLLQGATLQARKMGYSVTLWLTGESTDEASFYNDALTNRLPDGLIIASAVLDETVMNRLNNCGKPYILIGHPPSNHDECNYVDVDNIEASYQMVRYLIGRGYQRIGVIPGRDGLMSSADRLAGYKKALLDCGLSLDETLIAPSGHYTEMGARSSMEYLLQQQVDAVFASSDMMAIGAMRLIQDSGLRVPDDIAMAGFDNIPLAARTVPALTTIQQPIQQLGAAAAEGLINILEGRQVPPVRMAFPFELVVRAST